jgi:outer membrane receptor protein involved in Fe transport
MRPGTAALILALLAALATAAAAPPAAEEGRPYLGRPLAEVLEELRAGGLNLIYSSDLVTDELRVLAEPPSRTPRKVLRELLLPHGLRARRGPGGSLLIVRDDRPESERRSALRGTVRDARSDLPVDGARIELVELEARAETDAEGRFEIEDLPLGTYTLTVSHPGYLEQSVDGLRVVASRPTEVIFRLLPSKGIVESVVVTPSRYRLYGEDPAGGRTLTRETIERIPNLADNPNRVVARLPGVANEDLSSSLHIRGGDDDELLVLLDGMELYAPYHFEPHLTLFTVLNSRALESMDVFTGAFPASYGGRMGGVLDISSSVPSRGRSTELGVSFINAHLISEGTFSGGRGQWLAALRRGYLDIILDLVGEDSKEVDPSYGDLFAKAGRWLSERHRLTGSVLYAANDFRFLEEDGHKRQEIDGSQSNAYAWLTLDSAWSRKFLGRAILYGGHLDRETVQSDFVAYERDAWADDFRTTRLAGLKLDGSLRLSERQYLTVGAEGRWLEGDYDVKSYSEVSDFRFTEGGPPIVTERSALFTRRGWDLRAYLSDRIRLAPTVTAELGLRWDRQTYTGEGGQLSPRVNLLWEPGPRDSLRAAWGGFRQAQGIHELHVRDGLNEFLPAQETRSVVLGYERRFTGGFRVGVEAYRKEMSSLWTRFENLFHPRKGIPETSPDRVMVLPEEGRASGVEISLRGAEGRRFEWWLGYTRSTTEDLIEGRWVPRSWDQPHALTFSLNYRLGARWNLNASGIYHSGWPTTSVSARIVGEGADAELRPVVEPRNSGRYPDYHRLDVRASRSLAVKRGSLTLYLEVINLLDSSNSSYGDDFRYNVLPDGNVRVDRTLDISLPRVPSFGVSWVF